MFTSYDIGETALPKNKDIGKKRTRKNKKKFDAANFVLFVFKPKSSPLKKSFYSLSFQQRLDTLTANIQTTNYYIQTDLNNHSQLKTMFVSVDYLFKKLNKKGVKRYYDEKKKERYIATLKSLSLNTDMIIAPGTICWRKMDKETGHAYFYNMIHFFYRGEVKSYKKSYPHPADFDFLTNKKGLLSTMHFVSGEDDAPIVNINGIRFGVEICLDNAYKHLYYRQNKYTNPYLVTSSTEQKALSIDIHLLVADGIRRTNFLNQPRTLMVKVERTPKYKDQIGTLFVSSDKKKQQSNAMPHYDVHPAKREYLTSELSVVDFKNPGFGNS